MKTHKQQLFTFLLAGSLMLAACSPTGSAPPTPLSSNTQPPTQAEAPTTGESDGAEPNNTTIERQTPDLTVLPIGDGYISDGPRAGYLWSCPGGAGSGGAEATGDWFNEANGTYDLTIRPTVDGAVTWDSQVSIAVQGDTRVVDANGLPNHPTGNFPISPSDDAYPYDRNPNSITAQSYHLELPANPSLAASPSCTTPEVAIAVDGVVINNATDAGQRDAVAHEIQDGCFGHPHQGGVYHYHSYSPCLEDQNASGHSALIGYALDGFGLYGPYGENGEVLTSADLDECHGHTHLIEWDGQMVEMFHYHASFDFPYTIGCFRGTPVSFHTPSAQGNGTGAGAGTGDQGQGNGQDGPPQPAVNACSGLSNGSACSFTTPNETVSGNCTTMQNQLACVP